MGTAVLAPVAGRRVAGPCRRAGTLATVPRVEATDSSLSARLAAGDDRALAEVVDRFGPAVHAVALAVLGGDAAAAQDVVQDVLVDLWRHPARFDERLGTLRTYLAMSARHRAADRIRSEHRRTGRELRSERLLPPPREPSPAEQVADAETGAIVRQAVLGLPAEQRAVVELAYFGGLSYRDVAQALGIPEGTAKSRVRLALARLEGLLDRRLLESS
jgi:RNA polymerase sigma-70 factor (ECF subfamily)